RPAHRRESGPDHHPVGVTGHPAVASEADGDGRRDLLAEVRDARFRTGARARANDNAGAVAGAGAGVRRSGECLPCWRRCLLCLRVSVSCGWIHFDFPAGLKLDPPAGDKSRGPNNGMLTFRPLRWGAWAGHLASTRPASTPLT